MTKNHKSLMIITTIVCLLPMILSAVLYKQLPDQIAIHWDGNGNPNNFAPKALGAFGLPALLAVVNLFTHFTLNNDPKKANSSAVLKLISKWAIPLLSVILVPITLFIAIGYNISIPIIVSSIVGILFIAVGNYLPKSKQNYTVGIKLPWTLSSERNWNKTHRLAGYLYILGGILMLVAGFLNTGFLYMTFVIIIITSGIPFIYSYLLYKKGI